MVTLSLWASYIARKLPISGQYTADCLGIMNILIAVFAWFTLLTSNPFEYAQELATQGRDLNPMLQDVGLIRLDVVLGGHVKSLGFLHSTQVTY